MKTIKVLLLVAVAFLLIGCSAEEEQRENCNCIKEHYVYFPPIGLLVPERYEFSFALGQQCGTTTQGYIEEYGSNYNRVRYICE
jgi:outer membrane biogenesis lipoprotein LolB